MRHSKRGPGLIRLQESVPGATRCPTGEGGPLRGPPLLPPGSDRCPLRALDLCHGAPAGFETGGDAAYSSSYFSMTILRLVVNPGAAMR